VSGAALSEPFTIATSDTVVPASAGGLPGSAATVLAAGKANTYDVQITNNGPAPEAYFVEARLATSTQMSLAALSGPDTTVPLTTTENAPAYLVPTDTTAFTETASTTGTTPIEFDSAAPGGDPDVGSTVGVTAGATFAANPIAQGLWDIAPDVVGAFGPKGAPSEPVATAMTATSAAFDPAVSAPTGDLWQVGIDPALFTGFSPVIVGPGETGTIPVTITPTGTAGTQVSGTLYVDDYDVSLFQNFSGFDGDQVAAIPYSYTVK
jgi:hypothetical protein